MKSFKKSLIFAFSVALIFLQLNPIQGALAFSDVTTKTRYADEIDYLESYNLLPPEFGDKFQPDKKVTPIDFYSMLIQYSETTLAPETEISLPFKDTDNTAWYAKYLQTAINLNLLSKSSDPLNIGRTMKKREVLTTLFDSLGIGVNRFFDKTYYPFTDLTPDGTFSPYAYKAYELGIIEPLNKKAAMAAKDMTRADIANILYWIDQEVYGKDSFSTKPQTITIQSTPYYTKSEQTLTDNRKFDVLLDVWAKIQDSYLYTDEVNSDTMIYDAIKGFAGTLKDPYTVFTSPDEMNASQQLDSEYEGVGMSLELINNKPTVLSPFKDSPAEKAGIKPNDIITKIDGKSTDGLTLEDVVNKIKGKSGTTVTLTILRNTDTMTLTVTRGYILYKTATLEFIQAAKGKVALVTIVTFSEDTLKEFEEAAALIVKEPDVKGIIIDVRSNPGGYLSTAIDIANLFFKDKEKVVILEDKAGKKTYYSTEGNGSLANYKTVVLINGGSASASEILAGAFQDHNRAELIGEKSYGKGTVQEITLYEDGSTFKLTISKWLTPNGTSINKTGLTPDIKVSNTPTKDDQLDKAVSEVLK